jgi:hypothetical protein
MWSLLDYSTLSSAPDGFWGSGDEDGSPPPWPEDTLYAQFGLNITGASSDYLPSFPITIDGPSAAHPNEYSLIIPDPLAGL